MNLLRSLKALSPNAVLVQGAGISVSAYEFGVGEGDTVQSIIPVNECFKFNKMVRLGNDDLGRASTKPASPHYNNTTEQEPAS